MSKASNQHIDEKGKINKLPGLLSTLTNLKPNKHLLHLAVLREQSNKRAGTASTKTKAEVRGGGKKPWKQKGTGRARAGSIRSPLWVGGGIIFGPKPRSYEMNLPKKARNLAIAQAIASKADSVVVLNSLPKLKEVKTKNLVSEMKSLGLVKEPVLMIAAQDETGFKDIRRASNNLPNVLLKNEQHVGVFEILKANTVVITKDALSEFERRFSDFLKKTKSKVA